MLDPHDLQPDPAAAPILEALAPERDLPPGRSKIARQIVRTSRSVRAPGLALGREPVAVVLTSGSVLVVAPILPSDPAADRVRATSTTFWASKSLGTAPARPGPPRAPAGDLVMSRVDPVDRQHFLATLATDRVAPIARPRFPATSAIVPEDLAAVRMETGPADPAAVKVETVPADQAVVKVTGPPDREGPARETDQGGPAEGKATDLDDPADPVKEIDPAGLAVAKESVLVDPADPVKETDQGDPVAPATATDLAGSVEVIVPTGQTVQIGPIGQTAGGGTTTTSTTVLAGPIAPAPATSMIAGHAPDAQAGTAAT